jgi:hypothetical protein
MQRFDPNGHSTIQITPMPPYRLVRAEPQCLMCRTTKETAVHVLGVCVGKTMSMVREQVVGRMEEALSRHLCGTVVAEMVDGRETRPYVTLLDWFTPSEAEITRWEILHKGNITSYMDELVEEIGSVREAIQAIQRFPKVLGAQGYMPAAFRRMLELATPEKVITEVNSVCRKLMKMKEKDKCECVRCELMRQVKKATDNVQRVHLQGRADIWAERTGLMPDLARAAGMGEEGGGRLRSKQVQREVKLGPTATSAQLQRQPWAAAKEQQRQLQSVVMWEAPRGQRQYDRRRDLQLVQRYEWEVT